MTVSKYNKDHLTFMANALNENALPIEAVIAWCDMQIIDQENPDDWLLELSMYKKHQINPVWQLVYAGASLNINDEYHMVLMSGAFFQNRLNDAEVLDSIMSLVDRSELDKIQQLDKELYIIEDYLDSDKLIIHKRAHEKLEAILLPYLPKFIKKINDIGLSTSLAGYKLWMKRHV